MVPSEKSRILVVPCYQIFCCCFSQKPMSFHQELLKHSDQPKVGTRQGFNLVQKLQTYEVGLSSDSHNAHSFRGHLTSPNTLRWSPELLVLFCIKDHGSPVLGNQASHFIPCALLSLLRALQRCGGFPFLSYSQPHFLHLLLLSCHPTLEGIQLCNLLALCFQTVNLVFISSPKSLANTSVTGIKIDLK